MKESYKAAAREHPVPLTACLSWLAKAAWCTALVSVLGCGGGSSGPAGTVQGKLTYNGAPAVPGAVVSFLGESGAAASGATRADGSYTLTAAVPVGKYKVIVMPPATGPQMSPEEAMEASAKAGGNLPIPASASVIPKKYQNPTTTPDSRDVAEGKNEINIDLTD